MAPAARTVATTASHQSRAFTTTGCSSFTRSVLIGQRSGATAPTAAKCFSLRRPPRLLCTGAGPTGSKGPGTLGLGKQALTWAQQNTTVVAVIFGATLVMYGFYRFSVRVMKFFFNVSDKEIFTGGFVLGMVAMVTPASIELSRRSTEAECL